MMDWFLHAAGTELRGPNLFFQFGACQEIFLAGYHNEICQHNRMLDRSSWMKIEGLNVLKVMSRFLFSDFSIAQMENTAGLMVSDVMIALSQMLSFSQVKLCG